VAVKKVGLALVVALLVGIIVLGGAGHLVRRAMSPDYAELDRLAHAFLEDLKFKDFADAAKYHAFADQAKVDIPRLIENTFAVKPEVLNIRDFRVTGVDLDDSGTRARTFFRSTCEILNTAHDDKPNEEKQVEGILYWHKLAAALGDPPPPAPASPGGLGSVIPALPIGPAPTKTIEIEGQKWFMKLESSLH
jgi:hypothetical protein